MAAKKKKKVGKNLYSSRIHIKRQGGGTNNFYATWSFSKSQKKIKITKKVYDTKKKKAVSKTKKYTSVISGYTVRWYYGTTKNGGYYLDKTITTKSTSTSSDLWTPPNNAIKIKVTVKVNSDKYKSSKSKTASWFSTSAISRKDTDYDEYPSSPSIAEFTITNKSLKAVVTYDTEYNDIDQIHLQILKDGKTIKYNLYLNANDATDMVTFNQTLSEVGSYQVRARVCSKDSGTNLWSEYSAWSSSVDTRPNPPKLNTISVIDDDKIKLLWSSVSNITQYQIEYVADSNDYFNSNSVSSVTVDNLTSYIISGLESGKTYYFRVRSVNGSDKSEPSNVMSAVLATKPSPPTTWSSTTTAVLTMDIDTIDPTYIYWVHNSQDGSAQRSAKLEFVIGGKTYYLYVENTKKDDYGELIDEISQLELWHLTVYNNSASNISPAGTIYDIFMNSTDDSIKWRVRTKGLHADYSDFSIERVIKAYVKPNLELFVTNQNGSNLEGDILSNFPLVIKGLTTPSSQTPISYYISIIAGGTYETTDTYGNEQIITEESEIYSEFLDTNEQLEKTLSASDVDFVTGIQYMLKVIAYMDSGLSAEASYTFTPNWEEMAEEPDAVIEFDEKYRYAVIQPYCHYYIGYVSDEENERVDMDEPEPVAYIGTAISGVFENTKIFSDSNITASSGDIYFNKSTNEAFACVIGGDASQATWMYCTTFDYSDALTWYSGSAVNGESDTGIYSNSGIADAKINDYYFNTPSGDIYRCIKAGNSNEAVWDYLWNCFWQVSPNTTLSIYRREQNGSYITIAEGIDNSIQSSDSALLFRDPHPSFNSCTYRIVATNTENGGIAFTDFVEEFAETSVVLQWDEKWSENVINEEDSEVFEGSILELPANIKLSDSNSNDVTLAEYIGRSRPVSYYGTQRGENPKVTCEFPRSDKETLNLLRQLMIYQGDVYIREPSGLGYWANVNVSYNRDYNALTVPVSLDIKPVEGGM